MGLTLVLGGQKSGKSSTAARRAAARRGPVSVVTPARADDPELAERIDRHREARPDHWRTIETFDLVGALTEAGVTGTVVIDALDTWLVQRMADHGLWDDAEVAPAGAERRRPAELLLAEVDTLARAARGRAGETILIAGQPGLGAHAMGAAARRYVDLHGLALQRLGSVADETLLVVAGRSLSLDAPAAAAAPAPAWHDAPAPVIGPVVASEDGLAARIGAVRAGDGDAARAARARIDALATPPGALGTVADVAVRLASIAGCTPPPRPERPALVVAAGDHGVHRQGVTPWPQELTTTIADVIVDGRAGASVFADEVEARTVVLDVGCARPLAAHPTVVSARAVDGTRDLRHEDALTRHEAITALLAGAATADALIAEGADVLLTGDVGIANTTASAALVGVLTGRSADEVTGPGAGADAATLALKRTVVADAIERVRGREPLDVLAGVGGAEHAALAGLILAGSAARVPVVLDGVIAGAAALVAVALAPSSADALVAGHRSPEPGASAALEALDLPPLLDLGLRLGEGSGALLAVPLLRAATRTLRDVATLADLGVGPP